MKISFATPEVLPLIKTGGLADVSLALPAALSAAGLEVLVFCPLYRQARRFIEDHAPETKRERLPHSLWIGDNQYDASYVHLNWDGLQFVLVDNPLFFDREHPYLDETGCDYVDNVARFSFFCRAILEYYTHFASPPDVFHAQDWQTALLPVYLKTSYQRPGLRDARSLFTVHNLGYQGLFPAQHLYSTGLGWEAFTLNGLEYFGQLNLLKGGIIFADAVSTVSPTYAREIQTEELGRGLHGVLRACRGKLHGILNGISQRDWNPGTDPHLPAHYSAGDLSGKLSCKKAVQRAMGLPVRARTMLLGVISRLDAQKGIELLTEAFSRLAGLDLQLVILGSGDPALEHDLSLLEQHYPEQVAIRVGYDEPLAHLIEAGADAFVMPSLYEPCGLNQMYSQRYGTVPIVRETGGLKDTVVSCTPKRLVDGSASGFSFRAFDASRLADAIQRAARLYTIDRRQWNKLVRSIMAIDHSWEASAAEYIELYQSLALSISASQGGKSGE